MIWNCYHVKKNDSLPICRRHCQPMRLGHGSDGFESWKNTFLIDRIHSIRNKSAVEGGEWLTR